LKDRKQKSEKKKKSLSCTQTPDCEMLAEAENTASKKWEKRDKMITY
jgi:hypothetical protein